MKAKRTFVVQGTKHTPPGEALGDLTGLSHLVEMTEEEIRVVLGVAKQIPFIALDFLADIVKKQDTTNKSHAHILLAAATLLNLLQKDTRQ